MDAGPTVDEGCRGEVQGAEGNDGALVGDRKKDCGDEGAPDEHGIMSSRRRREGGVPVRRQALQAGHATRRVDAG